MVQKGPPIPDPEGRGTPKKKKGAERVKESPEAWLRALKEDIDPMHFAGEGFTSTEEIPRPMDVASNPHLLGRVMNEEAYWPGPIHTKKKRK